MYTKQKYNTDVLCHRSIRLCGWLALSTKHFMCEFLRTERLDCLDGKTFPLPQNNPKIVGASIRSDEHTRLIKHKIKRRRIL